MGTQLIDLQSYTLHNVKGFKHSCLTLEASMKLYKLNKEQNIILGNGKQIKIEEIRF